MRANSEQDEPGPRRRLLCIAMGLAFAPAVTRAQAAHPQRRWFDRAEAMREAAVAAGDQPYGAVLVLPSGTAVEAPSRVVRTSNPDAHSEREAIREAQRLAGRDDLAGAVLYSTSRPCALCEQAAARANVSRMFVGPQLVDAGVPRL